jgi:hypothetical protein
MSPEEAKVLRQVGQLIFDPKTLTHEVIRIPAPADSGIPDIEVRLRLLDREEVEEVSRIAGQNDPFTKALMEQTETVARAMESVNGMQMTPTMARALLRSSQPQLTYLLWEKYCILRSAQDITMERLADAIKK